MDDSGLPQVNYGMEQPLAASTPRATLTSTPETQTTDTYRQIIPGMSEHLYPTLIADGSLTTPAADNCSTLQKQITSEIDKYLQEAAEKRERDDNYFDGRHMATNTSSLQQEASLLEQDEYVDIDEEDDVVRVLESDGQDTNMSGASPSGHYIQYQDELETILEEEEEEDPQTEGQQDIDEQDTVLFTPDKSKEEPFNMAIDDPSEVPTIVMGKLVSTTFVSDDIHVPTEKVGFYKLVANFKSSLIIFHLSPEKRLLNRYTRYCKC